MHILAPPVNFFHEEKSQNALVVLTRAQSNIYQF